MIIFCEQRRFPEELSLTRCMEDDEMVIDSSPDQAKATAFNLVDRGSRVTLLKQDFARSKNPDNAPVL